MTRDTERDCIYRPWPRGGNVTAVAFKRRVLKYVFDRLYGIDADGGGVPKRESS